MKNLFFILWSISVVASGSVAQTIHTEITKVTVYNNGARIQREAQIKLQKGLNRVIVEGLPASMVDESVQVRVYDAKLHDVSIRTTRLRQKNVERITTLKQRLNEITNTIRTIQNEIQSINVGIEFITKGGIVASRENMTEIRMRSLLQFVEQYCKKSYEKIATLQQSLHNLNEEKERIEKELSALTTGDTTKSLYLSIFSTGHTTAGLVVCYATPNAGWDMKYEVRADTNLSRVEIASYAQVYQQTGEDWNSVTIELSTSKPFTSTHIPELQPWYIDIAQFSYQPRFYKSDVAEIQKEEKSTITGETYPSPVQEESTSFTFVIQGKQTIPSDGSASQLHIATAIENCSLRYTTVPKVFPYVVLEGEFNNPFDFPLVKGRVNVYLDETFVNSFMLPTLYAPGEMIAIALGMDESLTVQRKLISKKTEYKGVINKIKRMEYIYAITLSNNKKNTVTVTLLDAIPVSRNEKITVSLINKNAIGAVIDSDGKAIWKVQLAPQQKKEILVHFAVEYPDSLYVIGLE